MTNGQSQPPTPPEPRQPGQVQPSQPQPSPGQPAYAGAPATAAGPSGPRANFGRRLVAFLVDIILLGILQSLLFAILGLSSTDPAASAISTALGLAYFIYFEGSPAGQTIGKKLLSIRVIDFQTGQQLGFGKAAIRYVARILSTIACLLGYFWMLWDQQKQTWHDKLATTVVVPESAYPVAKWPG